MEAAEGNVTTGSGALKKEAPPREATGLSVEDPDKRVIGVLFSINGEYNQIGCIADHASPLLKDVRTPFQIVRICFDLRCDTPQLLASVWGRRQSDRPEFDNSLPQEPERFGRLLPSHTPITSNGSFWMVRDDS